MEKMKKIWLNLKHCIWYILSFIVFSFVAAIISGVDILKDLSAFLFISIIGGVLSPIILGITYGTTIVDELINTFWFQYKRLIVLISTILGVSLGTFILRETGTTIELKDNLLLALISAPVAFVLWSYRDKNEHDKIENQRFDTNLKYFEQIQERLKDIQPLDVEKQNSQSELHLKISAILQLADFIQGRYGENLKRPAFYLLTSLWEIYVRPSYENLKDRTEYDKILKGDRMIQALNLSLIKGLTHKSIYDINQDVKIISQRKATFLGFQNDLDNLFLVGLNEGLVPNTICIFQRKGRDLSFDFHTK